MAATASNQDIPPLWQYVALADYRPPPVTMEHKVRTGLSAFWQYFRSDEIPPETPLKTEEDLQSISETLLEQIAPAPDGWPAALALEESLATWLNDTHSHQPILLVLNPPHGMHGDILQKWAGIRGWRVLSQPTIKQIFGQESDWIESWSADPVPWVLPNLERCYLRHAHGLALVRRLLDQASSGVLGRGVIGCDSWAWAFLQRVWPGATPPVLILQSFDRHRLARWFQSLANQSGMDSVIFRQTDHGDYVLPPPSEVQEEESVNISDFLEQLAAYSRGMPSIAHAIWRASLSTVPEEAPTTTNTEVPAASTDQPTTLWVTPWRKLKQPRPAAGLLRENALILHTLLLHNGLPTEWLSQLTPSPRPVGLATLSQLETAGLVEQQYDGFWRISPLGYPIVQSFLNNENYLSDHL